MGGVFPPLPGRPDPPRRDRARAASVVVPDGVVPLVGYREWAVEFDHDDRPSLRSLFHPTTWPWDRVLGAVCLRPLIWHGRSDVAHDGVPDPTCECGIYAFRRPDFETLRGAKGRKARGVVRGWGRYVLGSAGWRSEFAAVAAVAADPEAPDVSRALAERYGVPLLDELGSSPRLDLRPAVGF
jgi:hypothetical protein